MIGKLSGKLIETTPTHALIEVMGIGYEVALPAQTLFQLPNLGSPLSVWTHLVVREDAHQLYGFTERQQRDLFRQLIKVSGIGPKVALSILSTLTVSELLEAVQTKSMDAFVRVPGIGKKVAERLLLELTSLLKEWLLGTSAPTTIAQAPSADVIAALVGLGYKPKVAQEAVQRLQEKNLAPEALIKAALKELATL